MSAAIATRTQFRIEFLCDEGKSGPSIWCGIYSESAINSNGAVESAGENPDVAIAVGVSEFDDLGFDLRCVRLRLRKHQLARIGGFDAVGLDVKVVVIANDKRHPTVLLNRVNLSDADERVSIFARGESSLHARRRNCGNRDGDESTTMEYRA
jgi:hypothetical protein